MSFSDDPQMGLLSDRFTGSATATLTTDIVRAADRIAALRHAVKPCLTASAVS